MTIAAANVAPSFLGHQQITSDQLRQVQDPCVVFEHHWFDSDGVPCFAYTVGGFLDGQILGDQRGGATIAGQVIIIAERGLTRDVADAQAAFGLQETISALNAEEDAYQEAQAALARMSMVSPERRLDLATAKPADKSDEFEEDSAAIRKLRGDDILLSGGME